MRLQRLSTGIMALAGLGVAVLVILASMTFLDLRRHQAEMRTLLAIEQQVDELSATSDEMARSGVSADELSRFQRKAERVQEQLLGLAQGNSAAKAASEQIEGLTVAVTEIVPEGSAQASNDELVGPLQLPRRAHDRLGEIAAYGIRLDATLGELLEKRRHQIARQVDWLIGGFIAAVLGFGIFGFAGIGLLHRRLTGPVRQLESMVDRILAGDHQARATIAHGDELGKLAATLNAMLDQRDQRETELAHQKQVLEEREAMLAESQRIGNIGSWRYYPEAGQVEWSRQTFLILGFDPDRDHPDVEAFYQRVHPDDRDKVRGSDQASLSGEAEHDIEYRVLLPDGRIRQVHEVGEPRARQDGPGTVLAGTIQDITRERALEAERRRLNERLRSILESVTDAVVSLDSDWRFGYANSEAERLLALSADDVDTSSLWEAVPSLRGSRVQTELQRAMDERVTISIEEHFETTDRWLDLRAYPSEQGLTLLARETTEQHRMLHRLLDQEARLEASHQELSKTLESRQALINSLPAHIALLDTDGNILDVNSQWCDYGAGGGNTDPDFSTGRNYLAVCEAARRDNELEADNEGASEVAQGLREILQGERDTFAREYPCHSPTRQQWFRVVANRLRDSDHSESTRDMGAVVMHVDITERKRAEQALNRLAYEDSLTAVASRQGFTEAVNQEVAANGWQPHARVVMLDIHHHHDINETHGFEAGDELLITVARRLEANTPEGAIVGRSGGDEFVVYVPAASADAVETACQEAASTFAERFMVNGNSLERRASFGYTQLGDEPRDAERLLREAEMALFYAGTTRSPDQWSVYTDDLDERTQQRIQITDELRHALVHDEFELHFQPKVALTSGELIGAEALIRWWHPERGLQSPGLFIPIAEQSQLIGPIGDWVLNDACRRLRAWQDQGLDIVRISVNVSVEQFADGDFPGDVGNALYTNNIDPSALTLEITESVFEQNASSLHRQLHELHAMGVRLSLDDFGTGYSSLLYLQQYPFDEIKIDKGFVMDMETEPYNAKVIASVVGIADALGAEVIAEGVESESIAQALVRMGCHVGQGFHYSMPLASEDFRWLLQTRSLLPLGREQPNDDESSPSQANEGAK